MHYSNILYIFVGLLLLTKSTAHAQDMNISQTYASPLLLNPALTGGFSGNFRLAAMYRDQWASLIKDPYSSFIVSGDARLRIGQHLSDNDYFGAGVLFYNDRINPFGFSTTSILFNGAFHKRMGQGSTDFLSVGTQFGLAQKNFSYENFTFQDEFNGIDEFPFETNERLPANNFAYFDLSLGLNYSHTLSDMLSMEIGIAGYHLLEPNISFYQDVMPQLGQELIQDNLLTSRYTAHLSARWSPQYELSLTPRLIIQSQGQHKQLMLGSGLRNEINDVKEVAYHLGLWGRMTHSLDSYAFNDVIAMVGIEVHRVLFGLSYDISIQDITGYRLGQHVFELSIRYVGNYDDSGSYCPEF